MTFNEYMIEFDKLTWLYHFGNTEDFTVYHIIGVIGPKIIVHNLYNGGAMLSFWFRSERISVESLIEKIPKDAQIGIIFNLDLFKC